MRVFYRGRRRIKITSKSYFQRRRVVNWEIGIEEEGVDIDIHVHFVQNRPEQLKFIFLGFCYLFESEFFNWQSTGFFWKKIVGEEVGIADNTLWKKF